MQSHPQPARGTARKASLPSDASAAKPFLQANEVGGNESKAGGHVHGWLMWATGMSDLQQRVLIER
jgi:hypothetical protein